VNNFHLRVTLVVQVRKLQLDLRARGKKKRAGSENREKVATGGQRRICKKSETSLFLKKKTRSHSTGGKEAIERWEGRLC